MQKKRIEVLDSFRGIAIIMVILFHFFSRWTSLYPYQNQYDFFGHGKFGVQFFFMISGFVIFFTLEKTKSLSQFWFNRFIRLLPSMLFASLITYLFFIFFDNDLLFPSSHHFRNILVSLSFIQPDLIASLLGYKIDLDYISGSYWSLWLEIQFYVLASFLYFLFKNKFYIYFFIITVVLVVLNFLLSHIYINSHIINKLKAFRSIFNLLDALPFFCIGAIFYVFYENNLKKIRNSHWEKINFIFFVFFLIFINYLDLKKLALIVFFIFLFLLMIYCPNRISFLNNKILNTIGVSSYFLYLIHENIGVFLIHKNFIDFELPSFFAPIFYVVILIICSFLFTKYIETSIVVFFKKSYKVKK
jgi:peptidoglycan/LPS O-acetylase OafA/YrhL